MNENKTYKQNELQKILQLQRKPSQQKNKKCQNYLKLQKNNDKKENANTDTQNDTIKINPSSE